MKPFWGIDISENRLSRTPNGETLCVSKPTEAQLKTLKDSSVRFTPLLKALRQTVLLGPIAFVFGNLAAICIGFAIWLVIDALSKGLPPFSRFSAPVVWILGGVSAVTVAVAVAIPLWNRRILKSLDDFRQPIRVHERMSAEIRQTLKIPSNAKRVEILILTYCVRDESIVPEKPSRKENAWINCDVFLFVERDRLCIADLSGKYAVPLDNLRRIRTVQQSILLPEWRKRQSIDKWPYRHYELGLEKHGKLRVKPFHILEFEHNSEIWGIYFPCYELPFFEKLTNLKAE